MKFADHLSKADIQKFKNLRRAAKNKKEHKPKQPMKKEEKVNWVDIMGMNRDRFGRGKGGAMRRK